MYVRCGASHQGNAGGGGGGGGGDKDDDDDAKLTLAQNKLCTSSDNSRKSTFLILQIWYLWDTRMN